MKDLDKIRRLVGDITPAQLDYVDCAVSDTIGIFMPVAGQCKYATLPEHTHPAWSFIVSFDSRCRTRLYGKVYDSVPGYEKLLEAGSLKITHLLIRQLFNLNQSSEKIGFRMSVTRAIEFLNEHYGEKISVEDLSRVANLSSSRFSHVFKEETSMSPVEYILQTRLDCAKRMLRGNEKTLSEIALECGFNSSSYFYQCFMRTFNISPSDFRKSISVAE